MNTTEGVGRKKLRLVIGQDKKFEQYFAFNCAFFTVSKPIIYDIAMRKFIKEKFGVAIEKATGKVPKMPNDLSNLFDKEEKMTILENNKEVLKSLILSNI